jgi:hypothetical protein
MRSISSAFAVAETAAGCGAIAPPAWSLSEAADFVLPCAAGALVQAAIAPAVIAVTALDRRNARRVLSCASIAVVFIDGSDTDLLLVAI